MRVLIYCFAGSCGGIPIVLQFAGSLMYHKWRPAEKSAGIYRMRNSRGINLDFFACAKVKALT